MIAAAPTSAKLVTIHAHTTRFAWSAPKSMRDVGSDNATADVRVARHLPRRDVRDVLRMLADDGWVLDRTRGSHRQLKHLTKPGLVTVAGSGNDDIAAGTLMSILKQAGLKIRGQE